MNDAKISSDRVLELAYKCDEEWDNAGKSRAKSMLNEVLQDGKTWMAIKEVLRTGSTVHRRKVMGLIVLCEPAIAVDELARCLREDSCPVVRHEAAHFLGETKDLRAVKPLVDTLANDDVDLVRHEAAEALGELGAPAGLSALRSALKDVNDAVRRTAEMAILQIELSSSRSI